MARPELEVFENASFTAPPVDPEYLHRTVGGHLERRATGWAVTRLVGHIALPSGTILRIRSRKSTSASLLAWMGFVDPALAGLRWFQRVPNVAGDGDIAALTVRLFFTELFEVLARHGLSRHYRREATLSPVVRGGIDFAALSRMGGNLSKLPCRRWERLPDTPLNRLVVAAVAIISRDPILRPNLPTRLGACRSGIRWNSGYREPRGSRRSRRPQPRRKRVQHRIRPRPHHRPRQPARRRRHARGAWLPDQPRSAFRKDGRASSGPRWITDNAEGKRALLARQRARHRNPSGDRKRTWSFIPRVGPVVIDAKYKSSISSGNLQQLIAYCSVLGARLGVLVVPEGNVVDRRAYHFAPRSLVRSEFTSYSFGLAREASKNGKQMRVAW